MLLAVEPNPETPREALRRFAAKHGTQHDVMRALVGHDGYLVPIKARPWAAQAKWDQVIHMGSESDMPPGELWVFTDEEILEAVAKEQRLAIYGGPARGRDVFSRLPADLWALRINPGAPWNETWFVERGGFDLARNWAGAIAAERLLDSGVGLGSADPSVLRQVFAEFDGWYVLLHEGGAIVTLPDHEGYRNPALVFTSADAMAHFAATIPGPTRATLQTMTLGGDSLFGQLPQQGVDGVAFNPAGPAGTRTVDLGFCDRVLGG